VHGEADSGGAVGLREVAGGGGAGLDGVDEVGDGGGTGLPGVSYGGNFDGGLGEWRVWGVGGGLPEVGVAGVGEEEKTTAVAEDLEGGAGAAVGGDVEGDAVGEGDLGAAGGIEAAGTGACPATAGTGSEASATGISPPLLTSIHTAGTPLACKAARSAASVSTNRVFQKGCDNQAPSSDWRNIPSLTSAVPIFFNMTAASV
jgi:hypothetical protein